MTLSNVWRTQPNENLSECLSYLTSRLPNIQCCLLEQYSKKIFMRDKLLNATWDTTACRLAYLKPAPTLRGIIADLHASVDTAIDIEQTSSLIANHIDRRRHDQYQNNQSNRGCRFRDGSHNEKSASYAANPNVGLPITRFVIE